MIGIVVCLILALVLLVVSFVFYRGLPDSRHSSGAGVKWAMLGTGLALVAGLAIAVSITVQERTGKSMGISGGVTSDAKQWITRNSANLPAANQPGDNIKILREGMAFIRSHKSIADSPQGQDLLIRYSQLPERPTKLLSRSEEQQYYDGAQAAWRMISNVAGADTGEAAAPAQ